MGGPGPPRYVGACQSRHRVGFCCERSAYVSHAPLARRLKGSLWLGRQLKHCCPLTLAQACQEYGLAVRKFQRIVMSERLVLVDLPEDRRLVTDRSRAPTEHCGRYARDLFGKRQLRSRENADRHARIFRCREPSRACAKVARRKFVANPRG